MDKYKELREQCEGDDWYFAKQVRTLLAERDALAKTLNVLLNLHDARVYTANAWNETFEESRELLAAKRQEGVE